MFAADMKRKAVSIILLLCSVCCMAQNVVKTGNLTAPAAPAASQPARSTSFDVFVPIGKYIAAGDVESLSAWFAPTLEISILGSSSDCSRTQAKQILKAYFKSYSPRSFTISHQAGRDNLKYALGYLNAAGEHFLVTIFVSCPSGGSFQIQQLKIERME